MKKTKKITGIILAAVVGISSLAAGASVYADSETTSVQKHVVVLDPGHGKGARSHRPAHRLRADERGPHPGV